MNIDQLLQLFADASKRAVLIGSPAFGVVAGLDLEGRLYLIHDREVISRVNPDAIRGYSDRRGYRNPGGDGLWAAPEGTTMGYQYATGQWRVPPGLTRARFEVVESSENHAVIEAEVELINAQGLGIPTLFRRDVTVEPEHGRIRVAEEIEYIGARTLQSGEFLLAPWTLSQFDTVPGTVTYFPPCPEAAIRELYDSGARFRTRTPERIESVATPEQRYQIALPASVAWIAMDLPAKGVKIRRWALAAETGTEYIDIADAAPDTPPVADGVCYSIYSDPSGFMELEAAAAVPAALQPGTVLRVTVFTSIERL